MPGLVAFKPFQAAVPLRDILDDSWAAVRGLALRPGAEPPHASFKALNVP